MRHMSTSLKFPPKALFIILSLLVAAGCSVRQAPTPTVTPVLPTRTRAPSSTPAPTITPLPSQTPLPSPTSQPTDTPFPTPEVDFSKAKLSASGFLSNWRFFFAVEAEEPMQGSYYALVDNALKYDCEILAKYPNRLYCNGPLRKMDEFVDFAIYQTGASEPVFKGKVFVPIVDLNQYLR